MGAFELFHNASTRLDVDVTCDPNSGFLIERSHDELRETLVESGLRLEDTDIVFAPRTATAPSAPIAVLEFVGTGVCTSQNTDFNVEELKWDIGLTLSLGERQSAFVDWAMDGADCDALPDGFSWRNTNGRTRR